MNHKRTPWFDSWNPYSNSGKHRPVIVELIIEHSSSVRLLVMTSKDHRFSKISYQDQDWNGHHDEMRIKTRNRIRKSISISTNISISNVVLMLMLFLIQHQPQHQDLAAQSFSSRRQPAVWLQFRFLVEGRRGPASSHKLSPTKPPTLTLPPCSMKVHPACSAD